MQVHLGVQVRGFLTRLGGRQCGIVTNLNAASDASRAAADGILKYPGPAPLAKAEPKAGYVVVEYNVVGFIRWPVLR
jgi:hypothetical protein